MLNLLAGPILALIEKELLNHEPEVQELVLAQLDKLATTIFEFVKSKVEGTTSPQAN